MRHLDFITLLLVVVGALNWGLVGLARFDLVAEVFGLQFGQVSAATSVIYHPCRAVRCVSGGRRVPPARRYPRITRPRLPRRVLMSTHPGDAPSRGRPLATPVFS